MNFKDDARPLSVVFLILALIGCAVAESFDYPPPQWFVAFAVTYITEWSIERGIRKGKNV